MTPHTAPRPFRHLAAAWPFWAFPLLLWFIATFFLRGDIGFWADDYFHNTRTLDGSIPPIALTGKWPFWSLAIDRGFFIRPLYYQIVPPLTTLMWNHPWAAHLLQALCHAGVIILAWRFMLILGIARSAARPAALLLVIYPASYEIIYWFASLPTALAAAGMLGVLFLVVGFARSTRGWWRVPIMALGTFAVCCLNEQPATAVAAMPCVYWAALPAGGQCFSKRHILRSIAATIACGLPILVYVYLITSTALPGTRGSMQSITAIDNLPERCTHFCDSLIRGLLMRDFASGAWRVGLDAVWSSGIFGWGALGALAVTAFAWIGRRDRAIASALDGPALRPLPAAVSGLAVFVIAWVPVILMAEYEPDSRMRFWPCLGVAVAVAALYSVGCGERARDAVAAPGAAAPPAHSLPHGRGSVWRRAMLRSVLVAILLWWTVMHIGIQSAYRTRWLRDQAEGAQLRALVPNPRPFTLFQPIDTRGSGLSTGALHFDEHFHCVWWYPWTTRRFIQLTYHREDISAAYHQFHGELILGGDERGLLYRVGLGPRYARREDGRWRVPWSQLLPFVVEADGRVRVITSFTLAGEPGAPEVRIDVPQAVGQPVFEFRLPRR